MAIYDQTQQNIARKINENSKISNWKDWHWQLRHSVESIDTFENLLDIKFPAEERRELEETLSKFPLSVTPYYMSLIDAEDYHNCPVFKQAFPSPAELDIGGCDMADPLAEDTDSPAPGITHRYPDRVLFLSTGFCSTYCRYCTRSRMVGEAGGDYQFSVSQWDRALAYIEAHPEVRDVLLSGGDPLTIADDKLDYLLGRLRAIKHVEFIRLGSKVPTVLPMRITKSLVKVLRKYHPLWLSIHVTHPAELTPETTESYARLADAGIPLGSQTVLLKGINDSVETMKRLMHGLLMRRVKPYYLYQCDPITGSAHFRTPVEKGIEIIQGLRGHTTGYAVPNFVIDAPGGGGKIPLLPEYVVGRDGDDLLLRNFEGNVYRYPDPDGRTGADKKPGGAQ